jgi:hypothetical protein
MNRIFLLLLILISLSGCNDDVQLSNEEIVLKGNCNFNGEWFVEDILINEVAEVRIHVTERRDSLYLLKIARTGFLGEVSPCHLPEKFKSMGVKVVVSGKVYNHPTMDFLALPILLESIKAED